MNERMKEYSVYYLNQSGVNNKDIAKELGIDVKDVEQILEQREDIKESKPNSKIKTKSSKANSKNLMITETSGKGTKSVAIMTKAASEVNDEFRKNLDNTVSRTAKNSIYRPKKNK